MADRGYAPSGGVAYRAASSLRTILHIYRVPLVDDSGQTEELAQEPQLLHREHLYHRGQVRLQRGCPLRQVIGAHPE
eukprot:CAMPEP_0185771176 /NCGR_PEP_ID=MMETSP1174-20130828/63550_1 /TAXON_ID=35687 /ORGANISM="Dictyocha speculum, Strain CCMP1381" /LENGTH=76 /DNA_ID=CAMNT_0028456955 /DNA_START=372 /DNA_END=599 /DNA_ORIENTATION=+